ncbi:MAG: FAD/NAD(P)-binding oxidoreductase [Pseudomonadota bacterium]
MNAPTTVVLGAGPAGLAAAEAASREGRALVLVDDNPDPGGQIWRGGPGQWRDARADALWSHLRARPHVQLLLSARLLSASGPQTLLLETASGALELPWQRLIVCTGARELLLPFPGWTLPGVTGAGGMQALIKGGMPVAGKRVVVAGSGPLLLAVADSVRRHGGEVVAIAERRTTGELARFLFKLALRHPAKLRQALHLRASLRGIRYLHGATVQQALGTDRVNAARVSVAGAHHEIACDFVACGFGLVPALEVARMLGCAVHGGKVCVDSKQRTSVPTIWAAGESTGIGGVDKALAEGAVAGMDACELVPGAVHMRAVHRANAFAQLLTSSFAPDPGLKALATPATIVCRCEDVRSQELELHSDWRSAKLQTRVGMGPCQGRVCGAACEFLYGWGSSGSRPPAFPVRAATLAAVGDSCKG